MPPIVGIKHHHIHGSAFRRGGAGGKQQRHRREERELLNGCHLFQPLAVELLCITRDVAPSPKLRPSFDSALARVCPVWPRESNCRLITSLCRGRTYQGSESSHPCPGFITCNRRRWIFTGRCPVFQRFVTTYTRSHLQVMSPKHGTRRISTAPCPQVPALTSGPFQKARGAGFSGRPALSFARCHQGVTVRNNSLGWFTVGVFGPMDSTEPVAELKAPVQSGADYAVRGFVIAPDNRA